MKRVTGSKDGEGWLADDINHGRLDCFYGLLAVLGSINFVVYLVCAACWYRPTKTESADLHEMGISTSSTSTAANGSSIEENC